MNDPLQHAIALHQAGRIADAESAYREILHHDPENAHAMQLLGLAACQHGRYPEAVAWIDQALQRDPENAEWWLNLGEVHRRSGHLAAAVASLRKSVALAPTNPHAHYNLGVALRAPPGTEPRHEAADCFRRALALDSGMAEAWNNLGLLLIESSEYAQAVACYKKLSALKPGHPEVQNNLGRALWEAGRHDSALAAFERAIALKNDFWEAHANLGTALRTLGKRDAAVAAYQRAVAVDPRSGEMQRGLGTALMEAGQYAPAHAACRRAVQLLPDDAESHRRLAMALAFLDRCTEAQDHFQIALSLRQANGHPTDDWQFEYAALRAQADQPPDTAPESFVRGLFDAYALRFDAHLVGDLGYRVPEELEKAVIEVLTTHPIPPGQWNVLDLGCGTGLCGLRFRRHARQLVGVDLSPKMIEAARARRTADARESGEALYDDLLQGDVVAVMAAMPGASYDVILAGDLFIYVGALEHLFTQVARLLRPGGVLAFSLERFEHVNPASGACTQGFVLTKGARFAHSLNYIERLAHQAALKIALTREIFLRADVGNGWLMVLQRPKNLLSPSPA